MDVSGCIRGWSGCARRGEAGLSAHERKRYPFRSSKLPTFCFGEKHELTVKPPNDTGTRIIVVMVPQRKSTRPRLPFVEPKSVSCRMLTKRVGLVRITFFSGMFGIRFSRVLDAAIESLKAQGCDRLIIDLRGCLGGSLGFARLVSYMCPGRIPIGYDVTRKRQQRGTVPPSFPASGCRTLGSDFCSALPSFQFETSH